MILKCIVIDDETDAIKVMEQMIAELPELEFAGSASDPLEGLAMIGRVDIDILFLDVEMPRLSGLDLLNVIGNHHRQIHIILTTAHAEFAVAGFDYEVTDFLLKPVSLSRLARAVQKARLTIAGTGRDSNDEFFCVKLDSKSKSVKINYHDILYIEGLKNYVSIYTAQERIIALLNIRSLEQHLLPFNFLRVHKSYIVPVKRIKSIDGNRIHLADGKGVIPLGATYKKKFFDYLSKHTINNHL